MSKPYDNVREVTHPMVQHCLTLMRDEGTHNGRFRMHMKQLTRALFYEAMAFLPIPTLNAGFVTPSKQTGDGLFIDSSLFALISTVRTGMEMSGTIQESLEEAEIGHVYFYKKDPVTRVSPEPTIRIPDLDRKFVFVFDSGMLSGNSVIEILRYVVEERRVHPKRIAVIACIASRPSIELINSVFDPAQNPIQIVTAAIDDWVEGEDCSRPGVGSFRKRLYGWIDDDEDGNAGGGLSHGCD